MSLEAKTFGELVKAARDAQEWTQIELAQKAKVSFAAVSSLERGEIRVSEDVAWSIIAALKLDPSDQTLAERLVQEQQQEPGARQRKLYPKTAAVLARIFQKYNIKATHVAVNLKVSRQAIQEWKDGKLLPSAKKFEAVLDYLAKNKVSRGDLGQFKRAYVSELILSDKTFDFMTDSARKKLAQAAVEIFSPSNLND